MSERLRMGRMAALAWLCCAAARAESWTPIELRSGLLTFPAVVEGVETRAVLNTSAPHSSVDAAFAERIGLTLSGRRERVSGAHSGSREVATEAQLDVDVLGVKTALRDTPALFHPEAALQLGAEFLEPFVVQIDYPRSRIRILPRADLDLRKHANVPLRAAQGSCRRARTSSSLGDPASSVNDFLRESSPRSAESAESTPCLPTVRLSFPGDRKLWLLLDTGAAGPLLVSRAVAKQAGWLETHRSGSSEASDVFGRRVALELLVLPSVTLGPFELGDVPVAVPAEGERVFGEGETRARAETGTHVTRGARASGRIGYDVLRHFVVTLDLSRGRMQIERPTRASADDSEAAPTP